jgi:hypothetical protein
LALPDPADLELDLAELLRLGFGNQLQPAGKTSGGVTAIGLNRSSPPWLAEHDVGEPHQQTRQQRANQTALPDTKVR